MDSQNSIPYGIPLKNFPISRNHCFLCGTELHENNRSEEHVYPKWLQNKFNLWTQRLGLLNNTSILYKDLKVPCCKKCNLKMSYELEKPMEQAVSGGFDKLSTIDHDTIYLWLSKLAYGVLYKELSLSIDRSNPEKGFIVDESDFRERETEFLLMQTILSNGEFVGEKPYSMLLFRITEDEKFDKYWAFESPDTHTFCMRMNDIGIISNLMDNSFNEHVFLDVPETKALLDETLHPIQFAELCAKFQYKSALFLRRPWYTFILDDEGKPAHTLSLPVSGVGYAEWNQEQYAHVLAYFLQPWGLTFSDLYKDNGLVLSLLWNEDFTFKRDLNFC